MEGKKQAALQPAIATIFEFAINCARDEHKDTDVFKNALGVLGDLGQAYGRYMQGMFRHPTVAIAIEEGLKEEETNSAADWAKQVCSRYHIV
jgi:hypothetical protein